VLQGETDKKMQLYCTVTERLFCCRDYTSVIFIFVVLDSGLPFDVLYIIIIYLIMC
jgi:hypothetical protein